MKRFALVVALALAASAQAAPPAPQYIDYGAIIERAYANYRAAKEGRAYVPRPQTQRQDAYEQILREEQEQTELLRSLQHQ